jgi:hypothetical protein
MTTLMRLLKTDGNTKIIIAMRRRTRRLLGNWFMIVFSLPILSALFESDSKQSNVETNNPEEK